ncbi:MAG: ABC transporter ATP-binding protein [Planctomycetales bacterium]
MIEIQNVTKSYRRGTTEVRALRGLTCQIRPAALTFIVGPSGSGKSSLLYLLGALDRPTSGDISIQGTWLSQFTRQERDRFRRDQVGFVFQNFNLLANLNAVENVLVPQIPRGISPTLRRSAEDLLRRVGLGDRLDHRPSQLSGGEQQRVAIARALLKRPILVLADEPTGELDSASGAEVYGYLRALRDEQGSTVVVVTHDRSHIAPGDQVLSLKDGQLEQVPATD